MDVTTLTTSRLILREWRDEDLPAFAALNADPRVMEFMPKVMTREESDVTAGRIRDHFARRGYGPWAIEVAGVAPFIGFIGLSVPRFAAHFTPCVEVGWRLAFDYWGRGYATEGARAALHYGFEALKLEQVVSFTAEINKRSSAVMERIGMSHDAADDFDHPVLPEGHPLRRHVLYRMNQRAWAEQMSRSS